MPDVLARPLTLPCGAVIPNRLAKAAMTEGLATAQGVPTPALDQLYGLWSDGGAGLLLSGNIIVDGAHLERPGNVVIERKPDAAMREALARWAGRLAGVPRRRELATVPRVLVIGGLNLLFECWVIHP